MGAGTLQSSRCYEARSVTHGAVRKVTMELAHQGRHRRRLDGATTVRIRLFMSMLMIVSSPRNLRSFVLKAVKQKLGGDV